jgi:hypothetical protein
MGPTAIPTRLPPVTLSSDWQNPTQVEWTILFDAKTSFARADGQTLAGNGNWGKIPVWNNPATKWLGINAMDLTGHIFREGFAQTTAPETNETLEIIVEEVFNADGTIGYWKFGLPPGPDQIKVILTRFRDESKLLFPVVVTDPKSRCPEWALKLSCVYDPDMVKAMQEFLDTGIVPNQLSEKPLIGESQ